MCIQLKFKQQGQHATANLSSKQEELRGNNP